MALQFKDRIRDTTTSTGTGAITPAGSPPTGFNGFSQFTSGDLVSYTIDGGAEWETVIGTWNGTTLSRDVTVASSNSNAAVTFSAGTKQIYSTLLSSTLNAIISRGSTFSHYLYA